MITYTIDVEPDLHNLKYKGITKGLKTAEKLFDKYNIKPILFVTCDCIKKYPEIFKNLSKKGWEISLHGFKHERFDTLSYKEKEIQIKKSINCFKKYLGKKPTGFRAPQHSIDKETLDLLEKYNFKYDSSFAPLNFLQLIFFPKKIFPWFKQFFSPINPYKIRENLIEKPVSSLLFPFVSLLLRISPKFLLLVYVKLIRLIYKNPVFYCHSWDFIKVEHSRIEKLFSHEKFIKNLKYIIKNG